VKSLFRRAIHKYWSVRVDGAKDDVGQPEADQDQS